MLHHWYPACSAILAAGVQHIFLSSAPKALSPYRVFSSAGWGDDWTGGADVRRTCTWVFALSWWRQLAGVLSEEENPFFRGRYVAAPRHSAAAGWRWLAFANFCMGGNGENRGSCFTVRFFWFSTFSGDVGAEVRGAAWVSLCSRVRI